MNATSKIGSVCLPQEHGIIQRRVTWLKPCFELEMGGLNRWESRRIPTTESGLDDGWRDEYTLMMNQWANKSSLHKWAIQTLEEIQHATIAFVKLYKHASRLSTAKQPQKSGHRSTSWLYCSWWANVEDRFTALGDTSFGAVKKYQTYSIFTAWYRQVGIVWEASYVDVKLCD